MQAGAAGEVIRGLGSVLEGQKAALRAAVIQTIALCNIECEIKADGGGVDDPLGFGLFRGAKVVDAGEGLAADALDDVGGGCARDVIGQRVDGAAGCDGKRRRTGKSRKPAAVVAPRSMHWYATRCGKCIRAIRSRDEAPATAVGLVAQRHTDASI